MGVCNCSMFCCMLLLVYSSIAINLMGKRELVALPNLSSWCIVMVEHLFLAVPWGCLQFVIVVFPDHTHLLFISSGDRFGFYFAKEYTGLVAFMPILNTGCTTTNCYAPNGIAVTFLTWTHNACWRC